LNLRETRTLIGAFEVSIERTRRSLPMGWRRILIAAVLVISIILQLAVVMEGYIGSWSPRIWALRNSPAWVRAGLLSPWVGEKPTRFFGFVRDGVPENAILMVPAKSKATAYRFNLMQFFLFPRELIVCHENQLKSCLLTGLGPDTYILAVEGFPPREFVAHKTRFLEFDGNFGIFEPLPGAVPQDTPEPE